MKKLIYLILPALVLVGWGCEKKTANSVAGSTEIDRGEILEEARQNGLIMSEVEIEAMSNPNALQPTQGNNLTAVGEFLKKDFKGWNSAALADVTEGGSFGLAFSKFEKGQFTLVAKMGNLPDFAEGEHYEGWIVKRGDIIHTISVGEVVKQEDQFIIVFRSQTDLSEYSFFVLTLESDEDPAPSKHILEGSF